MIYAGTGHRLEVLGGHNDEVETRVTNYARFILSEYKPEKVISGMALGWDTALAIAAVDLNIPLIAAVPFAGQDHVWSKDAQERYRSLLDKAERVEICSEGGYATHKYHVRDRWMVDNSSVVLALWNGQKMGGTYATVKYANKVSREVLNVWPGWESYEVS